MNSDKPTTITNTTNSVEVEFENTNYDTMQQIMQQIVDESFDHKVAQEVPCSANNPPDCNGVNNNNSTNHFESLSNHRSHSNSGFSQFVSFQSKLGGLNKKLLEKYNKKMLLETKSLKSKLLHFNLVKEFNGLNKNYF